MKHRVAPKLETARLTLRGHRREDFDAVCALTSDPAVMRHIRGPQPREDSWGRMLSAPGMWALLGFGYWVAERREDGAVIGQIGVADFKRDMSPSIEGLPELGYMFTSQVHGQGYASEAARAVLAWTDAQLAPEQIVAIINHDNAPSIRLAQRLGFDQHEEATQKGEPVLLFRRRSGA